MRGTALHLTLRGDTLGSTSTSPRRDCPTAIGLRNVRSLSPFILLMVLASSASCADPHCPPGELRIADTCYPTRSDGGSGVPDADVDDDTMESPRPPTGSLDAGATTPPSTTPPDAAASPDAPDAPTTSADASATCAPGFSSRGGTCADIDECASPTSCRDRERCINNVGSFACLPAVTQIVTGVDHSCALLGSGGVRCWGKNEFGQVGDGSTTTRLRPVAVVNLDDAVQLSIGQSHTCALRRSGRVACWGKNDLAQLGDASTDAHSTIPVELKRLTAAEEIVSGLSHSCARASQGGVMCWGINNVGQLGDGSNDRSVRPTPVAVAMLSDVVQLAAGGQHTCARVRSGAVSCWGANRSGQTGTATSDSVRIPSLVSGLGSAVEVAAGALYSCARLGSGEVWCWGDHGLLATGSGDAARPASMGVTAVAIAAGGQHVCTRGVSGMVTCWGSNADGQIAGSSKLARYGAPLPIAAAAEVSLLAAGYGHTCIVRARGDLSCWGSNASGQLGDGTTTTQAPPGVVIALP